MGEVEPHVPYHAIWDSLRDLGGIIITKLHHDLLPPVEPVIETPDHILPHVPDLADMQRIAEKYGADAAVAELEVLQTSEAWVKLFPYDEPELPDAGV